MVKDLESARVASVTGIMKARASLSGSAEMEKAPPVARQLSLSRAVN
jgi:hypothetical protein